jgi:hypothetical protein
MTAVSAEVPVSKPKTPSSWRRFVPGTREWRRKIRKDLVEQAKFHRLVHFRFENDDRLRVRLPLRRNANNLAMLDVGEEQAAWLISRFMLLMTLVGIAVLFVVFARRGPQFSIGFQVFAAIAAFVLEFPLAALMFSASEASERALIFGPRRFYLFLSALIGTSYATMAVRLFFKGAAMTRLEYVGGLAMSFTSFVALVIVVSQGVLAMIKRYFKWRRIASFPESVVIDNLLSVSLWSNDPTTTTRSHVGKLLDDLEAASVAVTCIPQRLPMLDPATAAWTKRQFAGIATAIRDLKRLVIVPQPDSEARLQSATREMILALVQRNWSAIARVEPPQIVRSTVIGRTLHAIRTIVVAIGPITVLTLLRPRLSQTLDAELLKGIFTAAYVWAAVGVMMVIDPEFTAKLGGANLSSFLGGGKAGKGE